jgi:hypothetical protein
MAPEIRAPFYFTEYDLAKGRFDKQVRNVKTVIVKSPSLIDILFGQLIVKLLQSD